MREWLAHRLASYHEWMMREGMARPSDAVTARGIDDIMAGIFPACAGHPEALRHAAKTIKRRLSLFANRNTIPLPRAAAGFLEEDIPGEMAAFIARHRRAERADGEQAYEEARAAKEAATEEIRRSTIPLDAYRPIAELSSMLCSARLLAAAMLGEGCRANLERRLEGLDIPANWSAHTTEALGVTAEEFAGIMAAAAERLEEKKKERPSLLASMGFGI